jgi:hypothetical protein
VATSPKGNLSIFRSARFDPNPGAYREAIQCGPMLIENSLPVPGLNAEKIARRTAVATGPANQAALLYLTSVTLADTGNPRVGTRGRPVHVRTGPALTSASS